MTSHWDCYAHAGAHRHVMARDLLNAMDRHDIAHAVLVPFLSAPGFDDLLDAVREQPARFRAVCRVDAAASQLDQAAAEKLLARGFSGMRVALPVLGPRGDTLTPLLQALDQQEKVLLVHAPNGIGPQAAQIGMWTEQYPRLRVFVPHLGWPRTAEGLPTPDWQAGIRALAGHPRIYLGLSALYYCSQQGPPFVDTHELVQTALRSFGPARCVLAGDYPMTLERCTYAQVWESLGAAISDPVALAQMWDETPLRLWREETP
jgi:predicted TIM-barrel fold metal-dependent hydrolase